MELLFNFFFKVVVVVVVVVVVDGLGLGIIRVQKEIATQKFIVDVEGVAGRLQVELLGGIDASNEIRKIPNNLTSKTAPLPSPPPPK